MELGIIIAALGLLLIVRWFNRAFNHMVSNLVTLGREAERFEKEE